MTLSQKKMIARRYSGYFEKFVAVTSGNTDSILHEKVMTVDIDKPKDNFVAPDKVTKESSQFQTGDLNASSALCIYGNQIIFW